MSANERERLDKALRWLRSHLNRLELERKSLEMKLAGMRAEIDRVRDELETAETRRQNLGRD